jgi:hypothetical protein
MFKKSQNALFVYRMKTNDIYTCAGNMNGAEARRFLFILLLLASLAALPDGSRDQTRSSEAAFASPDANKEKVRPAELPSTESDGNENLKTAEAVVAAPEELAGAEARSAKQAASREQARSEDNSMEGRFLDLWKTLRADFMSSHMFFTRVFLFSLFKPSLLRFKKRFFPDIFFLSLHHTLLRPCTFLIILPRFLRRLGLGKGIVRR